MDSFGSNASPMSGAAGRCDAMVAAVESQAADGVLHVHLFMFVQMAMQFCNLHELAEFLREKMLSAEVLKQYVSHVRCVVIRMLTRIDSPGRWWKKRGPPLPTISVSHVCRSSSGSHRRPQVKSGCGSITLGCNMPSLG